MGQTQQLYAACISSQCLLFPPTELPQEQMAAHEYIGLESPDFSQFDKDHHGCIIGVVLMVGVFCSPQTFLVSGLEKSFKLRSALSTNNMQHP